MLSKPPTAGSSINDLQLQVLELPLQCLLLQFCINLQSNPFFSFWHHVKSCGNIKLHMAEHSDWDVDLSTWKYMFLPLMSPDPSAFVQGKGHYQTRSHFTHWWNNRRTKIIYNCNHTLQPHNQSHNMFWASVYNTNATRLRPKATSWCRSLKSSFFIKDFLFSNGKNDLSTVNQIDGLWLLISLFFPCQSQSSFYSVVPV